MFVRTHRPGPEVGCPAHLRGDGPARDLAERLVALGPAGGSQVPRALGLAEPEFAVALAADRSVMFLLALPLAALDPCREVHGLVGRAPWLTAVGAGIVPLVDTRRHAIVRRGAAAFTVAWDGTLRVR